MTDALIAFLRARLKDDEDVALLSSPWPWKLNAEHDTVLAEDDIDVAEVFALSNNQLRTTAAHIARHDPARVIAGVEAHRLLIDDLAAIVGGTYCDDGELVLAEAVLMRLGAAYLDHPEYRPEWKLPA